MFLACNQCPDLNFDQSQERTTVTTGVNANGCIYRIITCTSTSAINNVYVGFYYNYNEVNLDTSSGTTVSRTITCNTDGTWTYTYTDINGNTQTVEILNVGCRRVTCTTCPPIRYLGNDNNLEVSTTIVNGCRVTTFTCNRNNNNGRAVLIWNGEELLEDTDNDGSVSRTLTCNGNGYWGYNFVPRNGATTQTVAVTSVTCQTR
uniref:C6 domain-containing protein n=1 Tax=Rhabditophanes sp. KR3021 TaxID=114890 RepID=A0AC35TL85_9BILA